MMADAPTMLGHHDPVAGRMVEELFRSAASRVRTRLVNRLGTDVPVGPVALEWTQLGQVLQRFTAGMAVCTFQVAPSELTGIVAVEPELLARLVGQILGQSVEQAGNASGERLPSRFDLVVARRIAEDVLSAVIELMPPAVGNKVEVGPAGSPARVSPSLPRTALVGAVSYEMTAPGGLQGRIFVVLPSDITRLAAPQRTARGGTDLRGIGGSCRSRDGRGRSCSACRCRCRR
ncbi:MAG: hypothetical protein R3F59_03330 [Myxococcota bacterium]